MKHLMITLFALSSLQGAIAATDLPILSRVNGTAMVCEIYADRVVIERREGEVKYTKVVPYKISNLEDLVERAYLEPRNDKELENRAFRSNGDSFFLNSSQKAGINLIRLLSDLCEVRCNK